MSIDLELLEFQWPAGGVEINPAAATGSLAVEGDESAEAPGAGVLALALEAQRQAEDAALGLDVGGHHGPAAARAHPWRLVRAHHPLLLRPAHHPHRAHRHIYPSSA